MKLHKLFQIPVVILLLAIPAAWAQQQPSGNTSQDNSTAPLPPLPPDQATGNTGDATRPLPPIAPDTTNGTRSVPVPTARGIFLGDDKDTQAPAQIVPDTHVLSDSVIMGIGMLNGRRNLFSPSLYFSQLVDTGVTPGVLDWTTTIGGSLAVDQFRGRNHFILLYNGAATFFRPSSYNDTTYHDLSITEEIRWQRWVVRFRNDLQISPQVTFGGLDSGGPGLLGIILVPSTAIPSILPGETILTARAERLSDTVLGDADYALSRHATLTFSGAYGWLHFLTPGYINSTNLGGRIGLNYAITTKDSIALIYGYSRGDFSGTNSAIQGDSIQLAYGRRVTGRLAFQVAAGPQYINLVNFGPQTGNLLSWSAFSALQYHVRRTNYTLVASHALSPGSGVFLGAETTAITLGATHAFTNRWILAASAGYSINDNLVPTGGISNRFDAWTGSASMGRQLGRNFNVNFSYGLFKQNASGGACPVVSCGDTSLRHVGGVTIGWHLRPIPFE